MDLPNTREEAQVIQSMFYFTGVACRHGHITKRYTKTSICCECKKRYAKKDQEKNKDKIKEYRKNRYQKNKTKFYKQSQEWKAKNREKDNQYKKEWKARNREKYLASESKRNKEKRKNNPLFKLTRAMSKAVWKNLKDGKGFKHWEDLVDFKFEQLKIHLQSKFNENMNWNNYGSYWEVDHIKPSSLCASFKEIWNLNNLQPLECYKNRSKGNRYIG